jgi:hypothetical protein
LQRGGVAQGAVVVLVVLVMVVVLVLVLVVLVLLVLVLVLVVVVVVVGWLIIWPLSLLHPCTVIMYGFWVCVTGFC